MFSLTGRIYTFGIPSKLTKFICDNDLANLVDEIEAKSSHILSKKELERQVNLRLYHMGFKVPVSIEIEWENEETACL